MMWVRIAAHYPVHFLDEVLTRRRVRSDSLGNRDPEVQFQSLFRNLEKLQSTVPDLASHPELFREAAYRICVARGTRDLHELNPAAARRKLRKATGYHRFRPLPWLLLMFSWTPLSILRGAKRAARAIRGRRSEPRS